MSIPTLNLYRVTLRGLSGRWSTDSQHKVSYVVASDPTAAYHQVRAQLEEKDYGFPKDRELESIELLASTPFYTDAPAQLLLPPDRHALIEGGGLPPPSCP